MTPARLAPLLLALTLLPGLGTAHAAEVGFNRDVRPILSNHCFYCHGPDEKKREGDLRLDLREAALAEHEGVRAIVPGRPDESELMIRLLTHDADEQMPPPKSKKPRVTPEQIATLRKWIEQGAKYEAHWAFLPLGESALPVVQDPSWARNPIDHFILARLDREKIKPSAEADSATLARRLYLDLTGLLPTPEEVSTFTPPAIAAWADRLLASPHYGERWGRHWLDQARYADSNGYTIDNDRAMWPFRDWVIKALNDDLPFDQFTVEQLAGDLLPQPRKSQLIATAFHRNTLINEEGGVDKEQFRNEAVVDRVNTTGAVWLGLTVGCAQCHTHKFDPITQREFYELFAFFNQGKDVNNKGETIKVVRGEVFGNPVALPPSTPVLDVAKLQAEWEKKELAKEGERGADPSVDDLLAALKTPGVDRDEAQRKVVGAAFDRAHPEARKAKKAAANPDLAELMVMKDTAEPRPTFIHLRGDFLRPDEKTGSLHPGGLSAVPPALPAAAGRTRLDLARWLVSAENPLTPRVTMNRLWMRYFGRGLVETEEDFGTQGSAPTHPELLDWLARRFVESGWSMKAMHRLIVTSATYRQSSRARPDLAEKDPRNLLLARQERVRVEGEIVRDAALSASGLLDRTIGGPGVHPPQAEGVYSFTQNKKVWNTASGPNRFRRALYTTFYRAAPYPLFTTFDAPDFQTVCTRRARSNTPLQALTIANDPAFLEIAAGLARQALRDVEYTDGDPQPVLDRAFARALCREPSVNEQRVLRQFFERQADSFRCDPESATALLPADGSMAAWPPDSAAAMITVARTLINTDGFITRE